MSTDTGDDQKLLEIEKEVAEKEVEERQRYIEFLADEGFERKKLSKISNDDLEKLYKSKKEVSDIEETGSRREMLVERLSERGFDRESLEKSSLSDLEHVWQKVSERSEDEEMIEKYESEAQRDFSTIMIDIEDVIDRDREVSGKIEEFGKRLSKIFHVSSEQGGGRDNMQKYNMKRILDSYRELEPVKSFIKSCFLMKGYLEYGLEPVNSMNFREMAEQVPEKYKPLKVLEDVFIRRHERRFGEVDEEYVEKVIDTFQEIIDNLEFSER